MASMAKEQPMASSTTPRRCAVLMALLGLGPLGLGLGACHTTALHHTSLTSTELAKAEDDLLAALRARSIVIANQVVIHISPNFYDKIGQPPGGVRTSGGGADEILWDVRGQSALRQPGRPGTTASVTVPMTKSELEFIIEGTVFLVTGVLRLRILHRAPPTLRISAKGDVRLLTENAVNEQRFVELRFDQGRVHGQRRRD